jgi:hypothetical protein
MKNITILLFLIYLGLAQAVNFCCSGTFDPNDPNDFDDVQRLDCPNAPSAVCLTNFDSTDNENSSAIRNLGCGNNSTGAISVCNTDGCNCPQGFVANPSTPAASNNTSNYDPVFGNMKSIMYPVMGVIFGLIWIALAFIGARLPLDLLLLIIGILDAVFGIFLIFIPITTFLGLFYMAVGAFTIAITRHAWGGDTGIDFLLSLTIIIFLLTGGLTFVSFDWGRGFNFVDRLSAYTPFTCDNDMNIRQNPNDYGYRSTRCHNYAYFVTFSVFLLFLIQPIGMIAAAFKRVGKHHDTTVVVNEKHTKTENKNTV